jgi:hypothetical protein
VCGWCGILCAFLSRAIKEGWVWEENQRQQQRQQQARREAGIVRRELGSTFIVQSASMEQNQIRQSRYP